MPSVTAPNSLLRELSVAAFGTLRRRNLRVSPVTQRHSWFIMEIPTKAAALTLPRARKPSMRFVCRRLLLMTALIGLAPTVGWAENSSESQEEEDAAAQRREVVARLRELYKTADNDIDKKKGLISWATEKGQPYAKAIEATARRDQQTGLANYGQQFFAQIPKTKWKTLASVLEESESLQQNRTTLIEFTTLVEALTKVARENQPPKRGDPPLPTTSFEERLSQQEQEAFAHWKQNAGYGELDPDEIYVVEETNRIRQEHGLQTLTVDLKMCAAARGHSKDMTEKEFFSHTSPIPGRASFSDRAALAGTTAHAENIFSGSDGKAAMVGWMKSEGHRKNILTSGLKRIGIGRHERNFTQMFGR